MLIIRSIKLLLKRFLGIFHKERKVTDFYISKVSLTAPWVYSSYLANVFYHQDNLEYMNSHQNKREAIEMVRIWNMMGYNVYVQDCFSKRDLPNLENVEIVFGHEPLFELACQKYNPRHRIAYCVGCSSEFQNSQVIRMTDYFNSKYGVNIPYRRMELIHDSFNVANKILMIGSSYSKDTLEKSCQLKVHMIHQSTQSIRTCEHIKYSEENNFFFMASSGNMLRGIPLLLDYFLENRNHILHVVGPIEEDVLSVIHHKKASNIILYGFVDVNTDLFQDIVSKCNFMIYPSGSEGGCPGSVLNGMKNGLIPIVTPWASFEEIEQYGYMIESWDIQSLTKGMDWALNMTEEEIIEKKKKCREYVMVNYTLDRFSQEFASFFSSLN